ncbi:MAG: iron ABC transporter permease [Thermotoga sp.]|nr:MAG: iron ABC transporter permease [Thermotoga sp.]HDM70840.1 iron ABC transporter permease [Thermotogales bacterium]
MKILSLVLFIIIFILIGAPLILLLMDSFHTEDSFFTLKNYTDTFSRRSNIRSAVNTLNLAVLTALFSTLVGSVLAWIIARTDIPGKSLLKTLVMVPYMIPPFIGAMGWMFLFGRAGYINKIWEHLFGHRLFNIHSFAGLVLVLSMYVYPPVFITVYTALVNMDASLEEAGRICGARLFRVMRSISLPLVLPSIMSGTLLVFAMSASNFGIPAIIGMPARIHVLTTRIMSYMATGTERGLSRAISLSVILIAIALGGLMLNNYLVSKSKFTIISGKSTRPADIKLGKFKPLVAVFVWIFVVFAVFLPMFSLALTSLWKAWGLPFKLSSFTLRNYYKVLFVDSDTKIALKNSFIFAIISATFVTILGSLVAYFTVRWKGNLSRTMDMLATLPQAIPGTALAVAMILVWSGRFGLNLYNTMWIIIVAYTARYLFFAVRTVAGAVKQIHVSLEEAGRSVGSKPLKVLKDITIPILKPALISSWALVFMPTFRELTISILLYGPTTKTIGVTIYGLQEGGEYQMASAFATIVLLIAFVLQFVVNRCLFGRRQS